MFQIAFLKAMKKIYAKESNSIIKNINDGRGDVKKAQEEVDDMKERQAMLKGIVGKTIQYIEAFISGCTCSSGGW